jgi:hypothetical protein
MGNLVSYQIKSRLYTRYRLPNISSRCRLAKFRFTACVMDKFLVQIMRCFEQDEPARLASLEELRTKLGSVVDDSQLPSLLSTLVERGNLMLMSREEHPSDLYFMISESCRGMIPFGVRLKIARFPR